MGGNDWFPWYFDRLRKSKWWRRASDMARARNVMLWGEAYKAVPAGSLADDDDELAEAAGFGMDVERFIAAKDEIMAPWTLCNDGRWYHPTVCEVVLDSWEKTSEKRKAAAQKKRDQRAKARGVPTEIENVPHPKAAVPGDTPKKDGDNTALTRAREQDRTGEDRQERTEERDADASLSPEGDARPELELSPPDEPTADPVRQAFDAWNSMARRLGLPIAKTLDDGRRKAIRARLAPPVGLEGWGEALDAVARSRHCRGQNDRGWRADLDFVCQPKSFRRLREGAYGADAEVPPEFTAEGPAWPGPPEVRVEIVLLKGEAWARGYLDRCRWRDLPDRAVLSENGFIVDTLRREVGDALAAAGIRIIQEGAAA